MPIKLHPYQSGLTHIVWRISAHCRFMISEIMYIRLPTDIQGQMLYRADLDWCRRLGLSHIKQLGNRILNDSAYQKLWIRRCDRSYNLLTKASCAERNKLQKSVPDLFLYGASEDKSTLYFEDMAGRLFFFKDSILLPET